MHYFFTPLNQHYDFGFGATGDAFRDAAETLQNRMEQQGRFFNDQLPVYFLYRHAAELYLKSGIIILHRRLAIPYGETGSSTEPQVFDGKGWKSLYHIHDIRAIFSYWKALLENNLPTLKEITRVNWTLPAEMEDWVSIVQNSDPISTFFRYPLPRNPQMDVTKSSMKPITPDELQRRTSSGEKPVRAFVVFDNDDNIVQSFAYDDTTLDTVGEALVQLVELLYGFHAAMRGELCGGS
jgi:hypothetical protein